MVSHHRLYRKIVDITPMTMTLFSVEFEEVQQHRQLWLGLSAANQTYTGDKSEEAKHIIWVCEDKIAGIASIVPDMKKVGADNIYWRLRAMAIDPLHKGTGKGDEFLQEVLAFAKRKGRYPLYGASRENSTQLYEKLGAIIAEKPYDIADQGLHVDFVFAD
jgi:GNAT superfamily N-acetyltransferase